MALVKTSLQVKCRQQHWNLFFKHIYYYNIETEIETYFSNPLPDTIIRYNLITASVGLRPSSDVTPCMESNPMECNDKSIGGLVRRIIRARIKRR